MSVSNANIMRDFYANFCEEGLKLYKEKKSEEAYELFLLGEKENDARCIHSKDEAAITADYLVKIHKRLKNFIEKINPKYLTEKGYYSEEF